MCVCEALRNQVLKFESSMRFMGSRFTNFPKCFKEEENKILNYFFFLYLGISLKNFRSTLMISRLETKQRCE